MTQTSNQLKNRTQSSEKMETNDPSKQNQTTPLTDVKGTQTKIKTNAGKNGSAGDIRSLVFALILGLLFGILMNKANVFVAPTIRMQMLFQRSAMLKMFLAAVGTSMLTVSVLILRCESVYRKALNAYIQQNIHRDLLPLTVGGVLIGVGMVVCGSCPGTVFVQIGAGIGNSLLTCFGALLGVLFFYTVVNDRITRRELPRSALVLRQIPDLLGVNRLPVHLLFGIIFLGMSIGLEFLIPWKADLQLARTKSNTSGIFSLPAWPPALCGMGVGLMQLFFIYLLEKSLGISTAFTVIAAQLCRIKPIGKAIPSLTSFASGTKNGVVFLFALGAVGGSFLVTCLAHQFPLGPENGANVLNSILGGFLLTVGARCAGGCTSGQGISGVTHLLIGSFIVTAAMFGGGILFAISYGVLTNDWQFNAL